MGEGEAKNPHHDSLRFLYFVFVEEEPQGHLVAMKMLKSTYTGAERPAMETPARMLLPLDQGWSGFLSRFRTQSGKGSEKGAGSGRQGQAARMGRTGNVERCSGSSNDVQHGARALGSPKQVWGWW